MDADTVNRFIRKGCREYNPEKLREGDITQSVSDAIDEFGELLIKANLQYFMKRVIITAIGRIFDVPSDCYRTYRIWDLEKRAGRVEAATNASPIVIKQQEHGYIDEDIVTVSGVPGNTAANGIWPVTYVDDDHFTLVGSTGNGDFSADDSGYLYDGEGGLLTDALGVALSASFGGFSFKEDNFTIIDRKQSSETTNDGAGYFLREDQIIIDDSDFQNDIILEYVWKPDELSEIPTLYHPGIVSYGVVDNIELPPSDSKSFPDLQMSLQRHMQRLDKYRRKAQDYHFSMESPNISDAKRIKRWI
jgi:hypothetical protein